MRQPFRFAERASSSSRSSWLFSRRMEGLDRLRGLGILLMVVDHILVAFGPDQLRLGATRASLPIMCAVAGALCGRAIRLRRTAAVVAAGVVAMVLGRVVGVGQPDVLLLLAGALASVAWVRGTGHTWLLWALASFAVIQPTTWPVEWSGYQPGTVVALVILGVWAGSNYVDGWGLAWPSWLAVVGRRPLAWYVGHLAVLAVGVVVVR